MNRATVRTALIPGSVGSHAVVLVCSQCHRPDLLREAMDDGIITAWAQERARVDLSDLVAATDHHYTQAGHK